MRGLSMLTQSLISFIFLCSCCLNYGMATDFYMFMTNSSLDNFVCPQTDKIFETFVGGALYEPRCLLVCLQNPACMSVFYNNGTGFCVGCNTAYFGEETLTESQGYLYFARKTKDYGERCFAGDTCTGSNQVCWSDTCICHIEYSLQPSTASCVYGCTTYGSTFQKYARRRIMGLNLQARTNVTVEECSDLCVDNTSNLCLSFEYENATMICHTSEESAFTVPDRVQVLNTYDLYIRNCDD